MEFVSAAALVIGSIALGLSILNALSRRHQKGVINHNAISLQSLGVIIDSNSDAIEGRLNQHERNIKNIIDVSNRNDDLIKQSFEMVGERLDELTPQVEQSLPYESHNRLVSRVHELEQQAVAQGDLNDELIQAHCTGHDRMTEIENGLRVAHDRIKNERRRLSTKADDIFPRLTAVEDWLLALDASGMAGRSKFVPARKIDEDELFESVLERVINSYVRGGVHLNQGPLLPDPILGNTGLPGVIDAEFRPGPAVSVPADQLPPGVVLMRQGDKIVYDPNDPAFAPYGSGDNQVPQA